MSGSEPLAGVSLSGPLSTIVKELRGVLSAAGA